MANVDGFVPEICGFRFANAFPSAPLLAVAIPGRGAVAIGDASNGLCGGMVFAARDYFESHRPLPNDGEVPLPGSTLFDYIVRRLIDSFALPEGPVRYFQWMALPDEDSWIGSGVATLTRGEGLKIKRELERGRLCCLGLVRARSLEDPNRRDTGFLASSISGLRRALARLITGHLAIRRGQPRPRYRTLDMPDSMTSRPLG